MCIISPSRSNAIVASRTSPQIIISDERGVLLDTGGGVVKALPLLGDAPFFHINSDTIWIDGVKPNLTRLAEAFDPATMDALLLLAPGAGSIGYAGRGDFLMASDGRLTRAARTRGRALRLCRRGHPVAARCSTARREGAFSLTRLFGSAHRGRPPARPAPGRPVDACRHARSDCRGRRCNFGKHGLTPRVYA